MGTSSCTFPKGFLCTCPQASGTQCSQPGLALLSAVGISCWIIVRLRPALIKAAYSRLVYVLVRHVSMPHAFRSSLLNYLWPPPPAGRTWPAAIAHHLTQGQALARPLRRLSLGTPTQQAAPATLTWGPQPSRQKRWVELIPQT